MTIFFVIHSQRSRMQKAPKEGECSLLLSLFASFPFALSLLRSSLLGWTSAPRCRQCHIKQSCPWQGCLKKAWLFTHIGCSSRLSAKYKSPTRCSYLPKVMRPSNRLWLFFSLCGCQEGWGPSAQVPTQLPDSIAAAAPDAHADCRTRVCHAHRLAKHPTFRHF